MSKGLQGNGNLTQLNLDNAMVGDDGLSALADMLIKNAALRSLTMRYNCFTHRVRGIARGLVCRSNICAVFALSAP